MRTLVLLLALAFSVGLGAQSTLPFSGAVGNEEQSAHLLALDFGAGGLASVDVTVSGDSAASGLQATLVDMDELATNGPATAVSYGSDPGTGTITLSLSVNRTGVRRFAVAVFLGMNNGLSNYTGTITATAPVSAVTQGTSQVRPNDAGQLAIALDISVFCAATAPAGGSATLEFLVDFGAAKSVTFWTDVYGSDTGSIEVFEINGATGQPVAIAPASGLSGAGVDWHANANFTTSTRSGLVRFRVVGISAPGMEFRAQCLFPSSVSVVAITRLRISGALDASQQRFHRFSIDFGAVATSYSFMHLNETIAGNVYFLIIDLDEVATNGPATGFGMGLPFATAASSGRCEFFLIAGEATGASSAGYDVEIGIAVTATAVTNAGTQVSVADESQQIMFDRAVQKNTTFTAAGAAASTFDVNFGSPAHTAAFWFQASGTAGGTVEIFEVAASGPDILLASLTVPGGSDVSLGCLTTSRSGKVQLRVETTASTTGEMHWAAIFDSSVTVGTVPASNENSGDDNDGGCSTSGGQSGLALLLAAIGTMALVLRHRPTQRAGA